MKCLICQKELSEASAYDLGPVPLFYGPVDKELEARLGNSIFDALLIECRTCSHVQQLLSSKVKNAVELVYLSNSANASTNFSASSLGKARFESVINNTTFLKQPKRVLEIGCQDAFVLYQLKRLGADEVVGVEPSNVDVYEEEDFSPYIVRGFFNPTDFDSHSFDTVIALFVLEHIDTPVEFLESIARVLNEDGQLVIAVPNAAEQLRRGDPGLFLHEHYSHFTEASLNALFSSAGFSIKHLQKTCSDYYIVATPSKEECSWPSISEQLSRYNKQLASVKKCFSAWLEGGQLPGLWGANQAASNILSWTGCDQYRLYDGDEYLQGKYMSGMHAVINSPTKANLGKHDSICIVPISVQQVLFEECKTMGLPYYALTP